MNKKQKVISILGIVVIFIMNLIPPWKITTIDLGIYTVQPIGYHVIFSPPIVEQESEEEEETVQYMINLDITRLIFQWVTILFILAALLFITKEKGIEDTQDEDW
jgi:hypothetical protein